MAIDETLLIDLRFGGIEVYVDCPKKGLGDHPETSSRVLATRHLHEEYIGSEISMLPHSDRSRELPLYVVKAGCERFFTYASTDATPLEMQFGIIEHREKEVHLKDIVAGTENGERPYMLSFTLPMSPENTCFQPRLTLVNRLDYLLDLVKVLGQNSEESVDLFRDLAQKTGMQTILDAYTPLQGRYQFVTNVDKEPHYSRELTI